MRRPRRKLGRQRATGLHKRETLIQTQASRDGVGFTLMIRRQKAGTWASLPKVSKFRDEWPAESNWCMMKNQIEMIDDKE